MLTFETPELSYRAFNMLSSVPDIQVGWLTARNRIGGLSPLVSDLQGSIKNISGEFKVFIGRLNPWNVTIDGLREALSSFGPTHDVILVNRRLLNEFGVVQDAFAFVTFPTQEQCIKCIAELVRNFLFWSLLIMRLL